MAHRVSARAAADLDEIWYYVARESGSIEIANRLTDTIIDRFVMLAGFPTIGRARDDEFGPGCRSVTVGEYVIVYCVENEDALILRVVHGRRDLEALFG
jgi:toxin ParE1/3/4